MYVIGLWIAAPTLNLQACGINMHAQRKLVLYIHSILSQRSFKCNCACWMEPQDWCFSLSDASQEDRWSLALLPWWSKLHCSAWPDAAGSEVGCGQWCCNAWDVCMQLPGLSNSAICMHCVTAMFVILFWHNYGLKMAINVIKWNALKTLLDALFFC